MLLFRGSLPQFVHGSNVETLSVEECREAIHVLQEELDLDPAECIMSRIDLAATMRMPRPVQQYLPLFGPLPRVLRDIYIGRGVQWVWQHRAVSVYDKALREKKKCRVDLPGNLLRFEVQYRSRLKRQLGGVFTLADLMEAQTVNLLASWWKVWYDKIEKLPGFEVGLITPRVSDLDKLIGRIGIDTVGFDRLLAWINAAGVTSLQKGRLRTRLKMRAQTSPSPVSSALISELDAAVSYACSAFCNPNL